MNKPDAVYLFIGSVLHPFIVQYPMIWSHRPLLARASTSVARGRSPWVFGSEVPRVSVDPVGAPRFVGPVPVLRVDAVTDALPGLLAGAGVPVGRPVVVIVGGAGGMADHIVTGFEALLRLVVVPVVERLGGVIVDGGTDSGVMRSVGRVRAATGARFPLVGVAVAATVVGGAQRVIADAAEIEPNHSLVLLVPGSGWGEEVTWISAVATTLAEGSPSVTVLVNGGDIAYEDVAASLTHGRRVVVLAGTGRTADAIAAAQAGRSPDPRAGPLASSDLTVIVNVDDMDAVRTALEQSLSGRETTTPQPPNRR